MKTQSGFLGSKMGHLINNDPSKLFCCCFEFNLVGSFRSTDVPIRSNSKEQLLLLLIMITINNNKGNFCILKAYPKSYIFLDY